MKRACACDPLHFSLPMSELFDNDDNAFKLAPGEEFILPGDEDLDAPESMGVPAAQRPGAVSGPTRAPRPTWFDKRAAGKLRARKVRRLVRHVEPWSVLKISLIFYFCLWVILLIAGVILWSLAVSSGTIDNVETFVTELFALESFSFNADQIFRASAIGGLVLVVAGAGFTVLMAVLFNLISDLTGGMRFTVVEEETARPRPKRLRPRKGLLERVNPSAAPAGIMPAQPPTDVPLETLAQPAPSETNVVGGDVPILATAADQLVEADIEPEVATEGDPR